MITSTAPGSELWGFFRTGQIATEISNAVKVEVGSGELPSVARERLGAFRFDQAPVVDRDNVLGWIRRDDLSDDRAVMSALEPLSSCAILSADSSLADALQVLAIHDLIFTAGKNGLSGFIVRSDLDRHAVRSYFYLLLSGVEMNLSELVRSSVGESAIVPLMRNDLRRAYQAARAKNEETHAVEYLFIDQLVDLFLETRYANDTYLWEGALTDQLNKVKKFRNNVMHPARSIAATTTPLEAADIAHCAEEVISRLRRIVNQLCGHQAEFRNPGPRSIALS